MNKSIPGSRSRPRLFDDLTQQFDRQVANILAPLMPERYHTRYCRALAEHLEHVDVLPGLPSATVDEGCLPLWLCAPDHAAPPLRIWDALSSYASPRLLIVGPVGSGKTTLLRSLAWEVASRADEAFQSFVRHLTFKLFGQPVDQLLPVLVDLASFAQQGYSPLEVMLQHMARHGFPGAREFLEGQLKMGRCLVLLDGLEHVGDAGRRAELMQLIEEYPRNIWLITSRPLPQMPSLPGFSSAMLQGIAPEDFAGFLRHYSEENSSSIPRLLAALERSASLAQWAQTPLVMAALCRSAQQNTAQEARLPSLLDACLKTALDEWATRAGYPSRYALDDRLRLLQDIAGQMQILGHPSLTRAELAGLVECALPTSMRDHADEFLEELTERTGLLVPGASGDEYAFAAPLAQSYLAARQIVANGQADSLISQADVVWWRDTIILAAGMLTEPLPFLYELQAQSQEEPYKWFLLADCLAESTCEDPFVDRVVERLFALLEDEDSTYWHQSAAAIAGIVRRQARDYFTALIRNPEAEKRRRAALAMGRLRQEWGIPSLGGAISDASPQVRQQAAWALGYIPSAQAERVLVRALRSSVASVREASARSIALLGQLPELRGDVTRDLIRALGDENEDVANLSEEALLQVGRSAMPQLMTALNDPRLDKGQRSRIARTLGRLGDERALPMLIDALLNGEAEDAGSYIEAVAGVGQVAVPALIAALVGKDVTTGSALVKALVMIGAPAIGPLLEAIAGNSPEVRNAAVRALEQIGAPAIEPLTQALLHDTRFEVRRRALDILGHIGESHAANALIEALGDQDDGVRINAVRYLGSLGDASAVQPLLGVLASMNEQLILRRAAIGSLSAIGDSRAVPALIEVMDEANLREPASSALGDFGREAVEPLIDLLHAPSTKPEVREAAWNVLTKLGAGARPDEESLLGLANVYAKLHDRSLSPAEILTQASRLEWWRYGPEICQSLQTAHQLAEIRDLSALSEKGDLFDWLIERTEWLRPRIKDILWRFKDVVENVKLYRSLTRRDAQRDALLSSIDRLAEIQQLIQTATLPFEFVFFDRVAASWRGLILEATKQLRGRASLLIELLTRRLPLREGQRVITSVFRVFNEGDSPARNLSVTLRPVTRMGNGVQVVGESKSLDPLGIGEERAVEMSLAPNGARDAELMFEAHYDDDEREDVSYRISCHIEFYDAPSIYTEIASSPYIVGMPVRGTEMFFGRQDIFEWVRENISSRHQEHPLILYGERRMGKTSVLYQLLTNPPTPKHICLLFDLQLYSYVSTVQELLFELSSNIVMRLNADGAELADPDWETYSANPYRAFRDFCDNLDRRLGDRRIVVMMDEFGVLMEKVRTKVFEVSFFDYLRGVTQRASTLSFMFTGAYEIRRMQQDYGSILFNMPKVHKITYLTEGEATELITKPVEGLLTYHPLVINKIHAVTACHPYFVQYICDELVQLARNERRNYIELTDLDYVIRNVVQDATGNIENSIYEYLDGSEKLVLAALANVTDDVRVFVPLADIAGMLDRRNLGMPREEILRTLRALDERDLVTEMRIGQQLRYSFRMGLVRTWLRQNEILLRLGQEREK